MSSLPQVLTHTYNPAPGPFLNLCSLDDTAAEQILDGMRRDHGRCLDSRYLEQRRATEDWLMRERRRKGIAGSLQRPIYFFLGNYDDGLDPARPAACVVPLDDIPPETLSFTFRDSMECYSAAQRLPDREPHALLYSYPEMTQVYAAQGQSWVKSRHIDNPAVESTLSPVRRGFVEVQVWCDVALRPYRERLRQEELGR